MKKNCGRTLTCQALIACFCLFSTAIAKGEVVDAGDQQQDKSTDFIITTIDALSIHGETLEVGDPIVVVFNYRYANPDSRQELWAGIELRHRSLRCDRGTYPDPLSNHAGNATREITVTEPGAIKVISLIITNGDNVQLLRRDIAVNFTVRPKRKHAND